MSFSDTEIASQHAVIASSFADLDDMVRFRECKKAGGSDHHCFAVGDNCVGMWGDDTSQGSGPCCALPPEDWLHFYHTARKKRLVVRYRDRQAICELRDTMPHKANIKNGAGIDLNPDACQQLGIAIPCLVHVTWQWL